MVRVYRFEAIRRLWVRNRVRRGINWPRVRSGARLHEVGESLGILRVEETPEYALECIKVAKCPLY